MSSRDLSVSTPGTGADAKEESKMIVVMGATGNTGRAVATTLLSSGKRVRGIGRDAQRLQDLKERGAEAAVGDVLDSSFLISAFRGAGSVYAMVPPDYTQPNVREYYSRCGESIGLAMRNSGVKRMVFLSSLGAEHPEGTGPIAGLHDLEERFKTLGVDLLILRPGYFYENLFGSLGLIKGRGINGGGIEGTVPVAMTATRDIGRAAADELGRDEFRGVSIRELLGPRDYTLQEATKILGSKIGKPELPYVRFPDREFAAALVQMGFSQGIAEALVEMSHAINSGLVRPLEGRNKRTSMPTSLESFADELAAAYRAL
jgi:uncharacterized protein YbjT (DUF2867 family)